MRLTISVKLRTTPEQAAALRETVERANAACDAISQMAWATQTFSQYPLHRRAYQHVRETTGLSAQVVVRCLSKVADAYKLDRKC